MITDDLPEQIKQAMKSRDSVRLSTLKMLSSEIHNAEIDKGDTLTSEEEMAVVKKEAKKRKDAIEAFDKAGNREKSAQESAELDVLQDFLPEELSAEELEKIVEESIKESGASQMSDMGKVMALAMDKASGRADGKRVSELVKQKLNA